MRKEGLAMTSSNGTTTRRRFLERILATGGGVALSGLGAAVLSCDTKSPRAADGPVTGLARATDGADTFADGGRTNFHFDCQVKGPLAGSVQHFLAMAGCGSFNDAQVEASGSFLHIDFNSPVPKTIFRSGSWKARHLIDFQAFGSPYGVFQAGIAHLVIDLVPAGSSRLVVPATLRIVCNVGPAGPASITGLPESIVLNVDGLAFDQPVAGLTVFTTGVEERD